ncbi:MAG: hydrogenase [Nitrospinae bacterium]|nr:hydrogenase [Nitrospinota bacterium]
MLKELIARVKQGYNTTSFPAPDAAVGGRFRGAPQLDAAKCPPDCQKCAEVCPTGAISVAGGLSLDLGKCLFCPSCSGACGAWGIKFTGAVAMAANRREDLVVKDGGPKSAEPLPEDLRALFAKSFKFRQVSAGGCNGCEAEIAAMGNIIFDLGRFGMGPVASPRHADGLLVTGPVTQNMKLALEKTNDATPDPKIVVAVGACAISGGPYQELPEQTGGADKTLPVTLYIPGCPPHPLTILDGLLKMLGRGE